MVILAESAWGVKRDGKTTSQLLVRSLREVNEGATRGQHVASPQNEARRQCACVHSDQQPMRSDVDFICGAASCGPGVVMNGRLSAGPFISLTREVLFTAGI